MPEDPRPPGALVAEPRTSRAYRSPFGAAIVKAELALVEAFELRALPLRGIFDRATGELYDEPVELTARTCAGESVQ